MFLILALAGSLISSANSQQFEDMDDSDFASYLQVVDNGIYRYAEPMAKGCITGGVGGAPSGFASLCLGCATGAAGNMAQEFAFPERNGPRDQYFQNYNERVNEAYRRERR